MKTILMILSFMTITFLAQAEDKDEAHFNAHKAKAVQWISSQKNIKLSRSHYGPHYIKGLSVSHDAKGNTYVDYYMTMGPLVRVDTMKQYPFRFSDIFVRYDTQKKVFRLIYHQTKN